MELTRPMLVQVFLPCSQAAADMTLRFIYVQNRPHLFCQSRIDRCKPVGYVLMYGCYYLDRYYQKSYLLVHGDFVLLPYLICLNQKRLCQ